MRFVSAKGVNIIIIIFFFFFFPSKSSSQLPYRMHFITLLFEEIMVHMIFDFYEFSAFSFDFFFLFHHTQAPVLHIVISTDWLQWVEVTKWKDELKLCKANEINMQSFLILINQARCLYERILPPPQKIIGFLHLQRHLNFDFILDQAFQFLFIPFTLQRTQAIFWVLFVHISLRTPVSTRLVRMGKSRPLFYPNTFLTLVVSSPACLQYSNKLPILVQFPCFFGGF